MVRVALAVAAFLVATLGGTTPPRAGAQAPTPGGSPPLTDVAACGTVGDPAAALKLAARAYAASRSAPGLVPVRIVIVRVVGAYVLLRLYPPLDAADPATAVMQCTGGGWAGLTIGTVPTAPGVPEDLFMDAIPYVGDAAEQAVQNLAVSPAAYQGDTFAFQYPGDATVAEQPDGSVHVFGPETAPATPDYEFTLVPLDVTLTATMDAYGAYTDLDGFGYNRLVAIVAQGRETAGAAAASTGPASATASSVGAAQGGIAVFMVERPEGDGVSRELYIAPAAGGPVARLSTTLPVAMTPEQTAASLAAISLVLRTLRFAS
jgi:hypothetical protein